MRHETVIAFFGTVGGIIASFFGGWNMGLTTLIIMMCVDYITGLIVAGIFGKSDKSENGGLSSKVGWKGLCKKGMTLLIVLVACRIDIYLNTNFCRDAVVIGYIANELISILENAGAIGVPLPPALVRAIDVLKAKSGEDKKE